jgi:PAS domain S-box-containing protein
MDPGVGPTVVSVLLSALGAWYFFVPPGWSMSAHEPGYHASMVLFLLVSSAMVWLARVAAHTRRATVLALQSANAEIAVRKQAERALADQRERFRVTLASIGDAVITTDREVRVTFLNGVAEQLTGWSLREAMGRPLAEVFPIINEDTRQPAPDPCQKVLRTGAVVGLANHTALIARDGTERPIADSAAPIIDGENRIQGVALVFRDVSAQRKREQEQEAAERDREQLLSSERAARADAERATRLKDEFVATLSHELRTPLNAILGWTQVLRRGRSSDPSALARGLEVIERNTRLQAQLISDLLDVSRIVSGKLKLELELVDLVAVIDAAIETVREASETKKVRIVRELDPSVPTLVGDHARLQQIIWNLLSNAVKFTTEGGEVRIGLTRQDVAAVVTVKDSGIGINPDFVPFLFDRFRQADSSTTRRFGGLGLGLAIVKQLTELHNGVVSAESPGDGQGATFTVRLPLGVAPEDGVNDRSAASTGNHRPLTTATRLDGLTVMLVEDDTDTRELVNRLLSESGARVQAVGTAAAALEQFLNQRPDILVSDIGLPGEDGYSLIERIRALPHSQGAGVPAIALTAFARSEDRTRALQAGFQAHVVKPVEPAELVATVASFAHMVPPARRRHRESGARLIRPPADAAGLGPPARARRAGPSPSPAARAAGPRGRARPRTPGCIRRSRPRPLPGTADSSIGCQPPDGVPLAAVVEDRPQGVLRIQALHLHDDVREAVEGMNAPIVLQHEDHRFVTPPSSTILAAYRSVQAFFPTSWNTLPSGSSRRSCRTHAVRTSPLRVKSSAFGRLPRRPPRTPA